MTVVWRNLIIAIVASRRTLLTAGPKKATVTDVLTVVDLTRRCVEKGSLRGASGSVSCCFAYHAFVGLTGACARKLSSLSLTAHVTTLQ